MEYKKPRKYKKHFIILFVLLVAIVILVAGAYVWYQDAIYAPVSSDASVAQIAVPAGAGLLDIASDLHKAGALKSSEALRVYLYLTKTEVELHKGNYEVPKHLNVPDLLAHLAKGPRVYSVSVTLQEGIRYDEMGSKIANAYANLPSSNFQRSDFLSIAAGPDNYNFAPAIQGYLDTYKPRGKSLEGFLFPDTYNLGADANALDVVSLLISTQQRRVAEQNINLAAPGKLNSWYEVLTLASIVEREANSVADKKLVADIFLRRLARHEVLGADATLLYAFKDWGYALKLSDIENTSNPYNSRRLAGLPPTPITNPSVNAIMAVLQPTANTYNFFISDSTGKNYYARTNAEHLENIRKYL